MYLSLKEIFFGLLFQASSVKGDACCFYGIGYFLVATLLLSVPMLSMVMLTSSFSCKVK